MESKTYHQAMKIPDSSVIPRPIRDTEISRYVTPYWNQLYVVLMRSFFYKMREPAVIVTQLFNCIVLPLLIGSIFYHIPLDQSGTKDRVAAISFTVVILTHITSDILVLFPLERSLYLREQSSGLYSTLAYYIGRSLAETPLHILVAIITASISYWLCGLQADWSKFLIWVCIMLVITFTCAGFMLMVGSICRSYGQANVVSTTLFVIFMLFDGNYVSLNNIPEPYRWVHDISFNAQSVAAAIKNEMHGLTFTCSDSLRNPVTGRCPIQTGEDFLEQTGYNNDAIGLHIFYVFIFGIVCRVIAYFGLRFCYTNKSFKQRLKD